MPSFSYLQEWKSLNIQSLPFLIFYFLDRIYWIFSYSFIGAFGKGNLGAIIIALAIFNLCNLVLEGFLSPLILLIKSTKGDKKLEYYWISISSVVVLISTAITCGVFLLFNFVFYYSIGLNENTKLKAIQFSWLIFPAFFFNGLQKILQQFLFFKNQSFSVYLSLLLGIVMNGITSLVFVYILQLGPRGVALSISCSKATIFLLLAFYCRKMISFPQ